MQVRTTISPAILAATTSMLQAYIPELSPQSLIATIQNYRGEGERVSPPEKPLTRHETAALLQVSLNSVNRYISQGRLRASKISKRLVRIDPQSVRDLLTGKVEA